ncbi:MAG TPA: hypothetical protein VMV49_06135 [Candidatus Deferrimicrobium sp.]|nr:hypothetical protein [Candidatus Deferrimicrobium sp.]
MVVKNDIFVFNVHFTALMFELIAFLLVFLIAITIFRKWRERRTIATLYLSIALFSIAFAAFVAFTGLASWFFSWIVDGYGATLSPAYYTISLPLGYSLVILYDVFIVLFAIQIFLDKNNKKIIPFVIAGIVLCILLFLPTNYWGVDPEPADPASTRIIILGLYLLYNAIICILLAFFAFKEAGRTEQKLHQKGFQSIAFGFITNLLIFVLFLIDSILILFNPGSPGYSIFVSLAWVCAFITAFMFYLGYILPTWFRNRIEER